MYKDYISKREFRRSSICQDFFIWNTLSDDKKFEEAGDDTEALIDLIWDDEVSEEDEQTNYGQRIARTFRLIDEELLNILCEKDHIIIRGTVEERIIQTQEALKSNKILIKPAFKFSNAVASPFAYDPEKKLIINLKYSSKTKRFDFIDAYYDCTIAIQSGVPVEDYVLFLPSSETSLKGQVYLSQTTSIHTTKTGKYPGEETSRGDDTSRNVISCVLAKQITDTKDNAFLFPSLDEEGIKKIMDAQKVTSPSIGELRHDLTAWGDNPEWNALLEKLESPFAGYSGNLVRKKAIADHASLQNGWDPLESVFLDSVLGRAMLGSNGETLCDYKALRNYLSIKNSRQVIWYDFEGFSLPIAALDDTKPYQQIAFQVSVIETINNVEVSKENIVIDPLHLDIEDFVKIIRAIYREGAKAYVVYNKGYELTRLREMGQLLRNANHSLSSEFDFMYEAIKDRTVDLYEDFNISSNKKLPNILLSDQKAKASIKNVEKHINKNHIALPRLITPYSELEVSNGGMAMEIGIDRALNIIGDQEWREKEKALKLYCENDVRAMIMVFDYVELLLKRNNLC